jgi:hypothetical protein
MITLPPTGYAVIAPIRQLTEEDPGSTLQYEASNMRRDASPSPLTGARFEYISCSRRLLDCSLQDCSLHFRSQSVTALKYLNSILRAPVGHYHVIRKSPLKVEAATSHLLQKDLHQLLKSTWQSPFYLQW